MAGSDRTASGERLMNLYYRLGAAVLLIAAASAQADTLRCGSQLVTTGDRAFEVERAACRNTATWSATASAGTTGRNSDWKNGSMDHATVCSAS